MSGIYGAKVKHTGQTNPDGEVAVIRVPNLGQLSGRHFPLLS